MVNGKMVWVGALVLALGFSAIPSASAAIRPVKGPVAVGGTAVHRAHKKPHRRRRRHHRHHRRLHSKQTVQK